jgi:hypothetical protein
VLLKLAGYASALSKATIRHPSDKIVVPILALATVTPYGSHDPSVITGAPLD